MNDSMIRQLDALEADLIFDTWRDTAMGRVVMKGFLNALRGKLFHALTLPIKVKTNGSIMRSEATRQYATIAGLRTAAVPNRGPTRLLSIEQPRRPPFSAAWAKEGDLVEVRYECKNNELYLAIIAEMQCKDMKAVVHFLDGDHALVGRKCMRYFKPYAFGETVNVRLQDGSNTWHAAQFLESVKSSNSTLRPVRVRTDAGDIVRVEPRNIRRILDDTEDDDNGDDDDDEEGDDDEYDGEDAGETYFLSIDEDYNSRRANDDDEDE
uniref:Uncharacterized protein n=1 Tax=Craspedostauros australis TaxID=1486917 RepID=A0A7S0F6Y8_9STRA